MKGRKDHEGAAVEAQEEAGLHGRMYHMSVGTYRYSPRTRKHFRLTKVYAYAMVAEG